MCPECGAPWVREVEVERPEWHGEMTPREKDQREQAKKLYERQGFIGPSNNQKSRGLTEIWETAKGTVRTFRGWRPSCGHDAEPYRPPCSTPSPAQARRCSAGTQPGPPLGRHRALGRILRSGYSPPPAVEPAGAMTCTCGQPMHAYIGTNGGLAPVVGLLKHASREC